MTWDVGKIGKSKFTRLVKLILLLIFTWSYIWKFSLISSGLNKIKLHLPLMTGIFFEGIMNFIKFILVYELSILVYYDAMQWFILTLEVCSIFQQEASLASTVAVCWVWVAAKYLTISQKCQIWLDLNTNERFLVRALHYFHKQTPSKVKQGYHLVILSKFSLIA